jgi:hypothetical protein
MILRQIVTAFLVPSLLACAAACSSGKASSDDASVGYTKIDDMEGENGVIEWTPPFGMFPGSWFTTTDCTEGDRISPVASSIDPQSWSYATYSAPHTTLPGVASLHAARLRTTSPLVGVWGAGMGFDFALLAQAVVDGAIPQSDTVDSGATMVGQPCRQGSSRDSPGGTVDLSAYSGITFWAMAGGTVNNTIQVLFNDINTDPRGGICNSADPGSESNCYNGFAEDVALTDTLTQYTIDFSSLTQDPTWGYRPDPSVFDVQHVYQVVFEVHLPTCAASANVKCAGGGPPGAFDFWIDDLYFVNK